MTRARNVRRTLANPLVIIVPFVLVLMVGWQQYVRSGRDLSTPMQNILPNGSFDEFDAHDMPVGWTLEKSGALDVSTKQDKGYVSGKLFALHTQNYKSGSLQLASAKVSLDPNKTYLYKGYYQATTSIDVLVKYFYSNGTTRLSYAASYPGRGDPWSTVSIALQSHNNIRAVQFVYRIAGNGMLKLDDTYLEARASGVYVAPTLRDTNMLIPNANLSSAMDGVPTSWSTYHVGKNHASFTYGREQGNAGYASVDVKNYKSGEAKWQYPAQSVAQGQAFIFGVSYRATAPSDIIAEYILANGKHQFDTVATLMPAGEWTRYQATVEAPPGAKTMFVSVVLHRDGQLDTDDYALRLSSRSGPREFQRPLVSITFDDGWKSAVDTALPVLNTFGFPSTFYLNPSALDTANFLSKQQFDHLISAKEEVASHGFAHVDLTAINAAQLDSQLQSAASALKKQGIGGRLDFAPPYGKSDPEVQYFARQYYRSLRTTEDGLNTRQNFDIYNLKVSYVDERTTLQSIKAELAEAKARHAWLIFVYHRVEIVPTKVDAAGEATVVTPANFKKQLELIQQSDINVKTVNAALDELTAQL